MDKEEILKKVSQEVGLKSGMWDSELCPKCGDFMSDGVCCYCEYDKNNPDDKHYEQFIKE